MTTTNPIPPPRLVLDSVPELTQFALRIDPAKPGEDRTMATLLIMKGERVDYTVGMPIEGMRRILTHLVDGITNHMENS